MTHSLLLAEKVRITVIISDHKVLQVHLHVLPTKVFPGLPFQLYRSLMPYASVPEKDRHNGFLLFLQKRAREIWKLFLSEPRFGISCLHDSALKGVGGPKVRPFVIYSG